ncbi:MAG: hypothetical protein DKM50_12710 [Candidatus Margulisiibacteriota bacterium]|nr:MAG: hypothetical protein A2X42_05820 [Candidatus Margulisbacteria bacterium GWF2_38_17]OGI06032.1 MAG: hypothetical protein A2X41_06215 [Candidatus Margulisbacteria bacterium GWE2_39_32]PZM77396.1 MAG: hypothetical protein DKM50_12710 [Candidatus Margulisiibacteriota bacterium]HAR64117.1 hypothetical protein [Candidatus Margulisiibacteriota bacterium]HCT85785.1 hypothetical protein [Candidatus Margulisiibacteriota bacterium]
MKRLIYTLILISIFLPSQLYAVPHKQINKNKQSSYNKKHRTSNKKNSYRKKPVPYICPIDRLETVLTKGVQYIRIRKRINRGPINIHVLKINLTVPGICIEPALANNKVGELASIKKIVDQNNALAAVNGSFFNPFPTFPIGRMIRNGNSLFKEDNLFQRSVFGINYNNEAFIQIPYVKDSVIIDNDVTKKFFIMGINRERKTDDIILFTPEYGSSTRSNNSGDEVVVENNKAICILKNQGNTPIPKSGYVLSFHGMAAKYTNLITPGSTIKTQLDEDTKWLNVKQAISGGPRLLKNGINVVHPHFNLENFNEAFRIPRARTAVGINSFGEVIFVVIEKTKHSTGVTFTELALIMKDLEAVDAMALDGGSSSSMYISTGYHSPIGTKSLPSINNALLIIKTINTVTIDNSGKSFAEKKQL